MRHRLVLALKKLLYSRRGEPYLFAGRTLRYLPGSRPIRIRYAYSENAISRYEALQIKWIEKHLNPGDTAVDIGASNGSLTILMSAKCGPSGQVVAFEPNASSREQINRNFALNPAIKRATVEGYACSDTEGMAEFHFSSATDFNASLLKSEWHTKRTTVQVTTVDDYIRRSGLPTPTLIKIDTEGAEIRVLRGAPKLLATSAISLCELHPYAWEGFGNTFSELQALLSFHGRRIRYLDQNHDIKESPHDRWGYGIAVISPI
jgi:FkbM family methyltransferase